jgi:hypothetical protein
MQCKVAGMMNIGSPYVDKGRLRSFFKEIFCKKSWRIAQCKQKPAKNNDWVANRTLSFKLGAG